MFHANFHGDFCNFSKITSSRFDLSIPPGPPLVLSGWSALSCLCSRGPLDGPSLRPAVVRLLKRRWRLYQLTPPSCPLPTPHHHPIPFPRPSFLSTHPPPTHPQCKLSQICQMMASSVQLPANSYESFCTPLSRPLIPPRNLRHKKKNLYPPFHCRLFHLLLSLSLLSLCLILVCASACHIKGEPGVTEPQAWNINAANCVAVWEINPLKIAPYTSWTHHQSLIHIAIYRIFSSLLCLV